jgi:UDP-glucose 6-dehydrogenase
MQIVGYTNKSKGIAQKILNILPKAEFKLITEAINAEAIKYFRNCFYATKVVFANQFFDYCQEKDIDYEEVKDAVKHDKMISPNHLEIFHQGGRGAGGKCLSKDLAAFASVSNLPLLKKVEVLNRQYLSKSKK